MNKVKVSKFATKRVMTSSIVLFSGLLAFINAPQGVRADETTTSENIVTQATPETGEATVKLKSSEKPVEAKSNVQDAKAGTEESTEAVKAPAQDEEAATKTEDKKATSTTEATADKSAAKETSNPKDSAETPVTKAKPAGDTATPAGNPDDTPVFTEKTAEQYVKALVSKDGSVVISNVKLTGSKEAIRTFVNGNKIFGMNSGIIMATGPITTPDQSLGTPGDSDIDNLVSGHSYDAIALEFDFVPKHSQVSFNYVFGSDEYPEFVGSHFNDAFAFFLNGENIALIPGTNDFVSINNVNKNKNSEYFIDNTDEHLQRWNHEIKFGGITKNLVATHSVNAGQVNHIKLVIADVSDTVLSSFMGISTDSFKSTGKVSVHYQDSKGNKLADDTEIDGEVGDSYNVTPKTITGYVFDHWVGASTGTIGETAIELVAVYTKTTVTPGNTTNPVLPQTGGETTVTAQPQATVNTPTQAGQANLPQTGEKQSQTRQLGLLGTMLLTSMSLIGGFLGLRKKADR